MGWLKGMLGGGRRPAEAEEWAPQAWETAPAPRGLAEGTLAFDAATATIASPVAASAPATAPQRPRAGHSATGTGQRRPRAGHGAAGSG